MEAQKIYLEREENLNCSQELITVDWTGFFTTTRATYIKITLANLCDNGKIVCEGVIVSKRVF